MSNLFQKDLNILGITPKQYGILVVVSSTLDITQIKVAAILRLDRTTIGQQIDILESKKLLQRIQSSKDKRAYNLKLSPKGKEVVDSLWKKMKKIEQKIIANLSKEQQEQFLHLTTVIYNSEVKNDE